MRTGWRLAGLGLAFLGFFVVLFFRLWFLQVAAGATYEGEAARQQVRVVATPAPRGEIRDRRGTLLAGSRASLSVLIDPRLLPDDEEQQRVIARKLAALLKMAPVEVQALFEEELAKGFGDRFRVAFDVSQDQALFVFEHAGEFPGVVVEPVPVRRYPEGSLAAHLLGYVGKVTQEDQESDPGLRALDLIGRSGVERQYDEFLRGTSGFVKYQVNARGEILSVVGESPPVSGGNLMLNVDGALQRVLEESLGAGITLARSLESPAPRAAGVVLDPRDGSVLAMASVPAFNPEDFVGGISLDEYALIQEQGAELNFAIQGLYPPASTFKTVTYVMALEEGIYYPQDEHGASGPDVPIFCGGQLEFGFEEESQQVFTDWKPDGHGWVDIHGALEQSCDIYFWQIALGIWRNYRGTAQESIIQEWARRLGFGNQTGIDLPFEKEGLVPDRRWFEARQAEGSPLVRPKEQGGWVGGDLMNVVIGQGAVSATPLQVANAYAAMVNGGTVWEPRMVDKVVDQEGATVFDNPPSAAREIELEPRTVRQLKEDLARVVSGYSGTARGAFGDLGMTQVGGKTGTGEAEGREDSAWFVGVAPLDDPRWVVAVVIEEGGSGGRVAAPVVRRVLQYLMGEQMTEVLPGTEVSD
ncbi:MAG: penicillin-binding protein 2 [Acidimicrobiia bacterium]